jgi:hypothetical protein
MSLVCIPGDNWGIVMDRFGCVAANAVLYELRFDSLFKEGRAYSFACNAEGHVDMDSLCETARRNYLYARAVIGHELCFPKVLAVGRANPARLDTKELSV